MKHISDVEVLKIKLPKSEEIISIEFGIYKEVGEMINDLKKQTGFQESDSLGIYNPRMGLWLDHSKTLAAYDLMGEVMQFRIKADEFAIRISFPDLEQKIAIRILPSFKISGSFC